MEVYKTVRKYEQGYKNWQNVWIGIPQKISKSPAGST